MLVVPILRRLRQADCYVFEASLYSTDPLSKEKGSEEKKRKEIKKREREKKKKKKRIRDLEKSTLNRKTHSQPLKTHVNVRPE